MGAPKGNTNALKHELYAKLYSPADQAGLRKMAPEDFRHEIYMMRVVVKNAFDIHSKLYKRVEKSQDSNQLDDIEALAKITNSLALAMTALNTTARTYALFSGTDSGKEDAFDQALNSLPIFLEDKYLQERNEEMEDGEIFVEKLGPE